MSKLPVVPEGQSALTPHIVVKDGARAIEFYKAAFGAKELFRLTEPGGKVGHAELRVFGGHFMLADEYPDFGALSPSTIGGSPVRLHLYVEDADAVVARAVDAGATLLRPVKDQFYGDRGGSIADPFGHHWNIATRKEVLSPSEMQERWSKVFATG
jgi:PhnB protein